MNYYQVLGVQKSATPEEIKKAFKKLASKHHPDKGGSNAEFQRIQEAYAVLGDPQKRAQYDRPQPHININGFNMNFGAEGMNFDMDNIFEMFGRKMHQQQQVRQQRATIWITLEDAAGGGKKMMNLSTTNGSYTVEVEIPKGIHDNENIRYPKIAPGEMDLIINYRIHPHVNWHREGLDIWCQRNLDFWQMVLGCQIDVVDIHGTNLTLTVPPRMKPGGVLRARGRGIHRSGHNPGDLLVKINPVMPENIPDDVIEVLQKHMNK